MQAYKSSYSSLCSLVSEIVYGSFGASNTKSKQVLILGGVTFLTVQILVWCSVGGDVMPMRITPSCVL